MELHSTAKQASIVNGVEIGITLIPNMDILHLQTFCNKRFGRMIIEDIYLYVCKRQFTDKVIVAHACVMEETKVTYPHQLQIWNIWADK